MQFSLLCVLAPAGIASNIFERLKFDTHSNPFEIKGHAVKAEVVSNQGGG